MMKKQKKLQEINQKFEDRIKYQLFGLHLNPSSQIQPQTLIPRKISLIELRSKQTNQQQNVNQEYRKYHFTKIRALDIIKEAKSNLYSSLLPRFQLKQQKIKTLTLENQSEGLNFTFAQNCYNKQNIMGQFTSNYLNKKFFS